MSAQPNDDYREAERRLWAHYGATPKEHFLDLERPRLRVRVQEVGTGDPVLFVHGAPNSGSTWAPLVASLPDFRCLLLDRPGTGLSEVLDYASVDMRARAVDVLTSVLAALGIDRLPIVASSAGGAWTFWLTLARPDAVTRMVQMGCPALVSGMQTPGFMRLLALPGLGSLIARLPASRGAGRSTMRQLGHAASVDAGRIPDPLWEWSYHLNRDTPTMRSEVALITRGLTWRGAVRPEVELRDEELRRIQQPTLFLWGEDDPFGGPELARHLASIMPNATLELFPNSGHLPWLDDPATFALRTRAFLQAR